MTAQRGDPILAVDIGGTKIMTVLFSADGKMLSRDVCPTLADEGVEPIIKRLCSAIEGTLDSSNLKVSQLGGIGIACAGGIDSGRGMVVTPSPNMVGWENIPLGDIVKERFKVDTYIVNGDLAAAAMKAKLDYYITTRCNCNWKLFGTRFTGNITGQTIMVQQTRRSLNRDGEPVINGFKDFPVELYDIGVSQS